MRRLEPGFGRRRDPRKIAVFDPCAPGTELLPNDKASMLEGRVISPRRPPRERSRRDPEEARRRLRERAENRPPQRRRERTAVVGMGPLCTVRLQEDVSELHVDGQWGPCDA